MHAYVYPSRQEKAISGAFAFGMHLVFLALLMFGVTWQKRVEPQANIVDLWASLPSPAPPKVEPPPPPPEPVVKPEPKPKPVEPPAVKVAPKPDVAKPDIAMKKKAEKDKAEKEKAEKERRALEEKQKEAKKREADAKKREAEAKAKAKAEQEQQKALQDLAQQQASAEARLRSEYIERIRSRIKGFILLPPNLQGNPEVEIDVIQIPGGEVLSVKLRRSSGVSAYDSAVERAILKASPLPSPPKPELFERELNLKFRPQQ